MQAKTAWAKFTSNHPKVQPFVDSVSRKGFTQNMEIAIAIRYPDGEEYKAGIRVQESDLELLKLIESFK